MKFKLTHMKKNYLVVLEMILILSVFFQAAVFWEESGLSGWVGSQIGQVGMCFEAEPNISDIPDFNIECGDSFYYDVNYTTYCHEEMNGVFADDASFFEINPETGVINFTATGDDLGMHKINIHLFENEWHSVETFNMNITNDLEIQPIPDMVINESEPFYYDVEMQEESCMTGTFSDNTFLFNIDSNTGEINFTPTIEDVGNHTIYIYAVSGVYMDMESFQLTIRQIHVDQPENLTVDFENDSAYINWSDVSNAEYYEIFYTENVSNLENMSYLGNSTNSNYIDENVTGPRYYKVAAVAGSVMNFTDDYGCLDTINFEEGWNLMGLSCQPDDMNITSLFEPLADGTDWGTSVSMCGGDEDYNGSMEILWDYQEESNGWRAFNPTLPCFAIETQEFSSVNMKDGYWIKMHNENSLTYAGKLLKSQNYTYLNEWNLYSPIVTQEDRITELFEPLTHGTDWGTSVNMCGGSEDYNGSMEIMWNYLSVDASWRSFNPTLPCFAIDSQEFSNVNPKDGYWIKMREKDNMTLNLLSEE